MRDAVVDVCAMRARVRQEVRRARGAIEAGVVHFDWDTTNNTTRNKAMGLGVLIMRLNRRWRLKVS